MDSLDVLLSQFWTSQLFISSSNCFVLTCIQISQETGKVVWYSYLFKNFPVCCDPHSQRLWRSQWSRSRCFFWNSLAFSMIQRMLSTWFLVPSPFLNPACTSGSSWFTYCWSPAWRLLSMTLLACEMSALYGRLNTLWFCPSLGLERTLTFSSPMAGE